MAGQNVVLEDCRIIFRNFSGKETKFNPAGRRNFCVLLDDEMGAKLRAEGWNVKYLSARSDEETPTPYIQVTVSYQNMPPHIYKVVGTNKPVELDEKTVGTLDDDDIEEVDLVIRPYNWEVNGHTGIKAYVKTMYVVIANDAFAKKYVHESEDGLPF